MLMMMSIIPFWGMGSAGAARARARTPVRTSRQYFMLRDNKSDNERTSQI